MFKTIAIVNPFISGHPVSYCDNEKDLKKEIKKCKYLTEKIGNKKQQIKPIFDVDRYHTDIDINYCIKKINEMYPNKEVKWCYRPSREYKNKGIKYSYRFYVKGVRCSLMRIYLLLLKKGLKDELNEYGFDTGIYNEGRLLLLPLTTQKFENKDKKLNVYDVPELTLGNTDDILDCCATYIEEDYEDYDEKYEDKPIIEPEIKYDKVLKDIDEENEYNDKSIDFIKDIINNISVKRAINYDDWSKVCFAIIGACKKSKIARRGCNDLIHMFSQLNINSYEEDKVDDWIDNNYKKQMEREKNQYGYSYLIHNCLKEDKPDYYDETYNKTYKKIKEEFEKEIIKINDDVLYIQLNHNRDIHKPECFYIKTQKQLIHSYNDNGKFSYIKCEIDKKGKIKKEKINIVSSKSDWWEDENKRKVDRLIFQPYKLDDKMKDRYFNMFQGFRVEFLPINKDYVRIHAILNHIKMVICNNDEYCYDWFLKYLCAILKGRKTNVFPMIRGLEGCGKNIILDMIAYGLIGDDYAIASSCPEKQLFNNFNSLLQNRVLTIINEGTNALRSCVDVIKDVITADKINIEKKGVDATTLRNYNNFIGSTNNFNIINISITDRRFVWLNCNNEYCGNTEYFNQLLQDVKDEKVLSALYHYLIEEIDCLDDYDFQKTRPKTAIYKKLQKINLSNPITYLTSIVNNKEVLKYRKYKQETYTTIRCPDLYEKYKCWCAKFKFEVFTYTQFEAKLTDDNKYGITKNIDRMRKVVFKINKEKFEIEMKKITDLEDLEMIDDGFIDDDDENNDE